MGVDGMRLGHNIEKGTERMLATQAQTSSKNGYIRKPIRFYELRINEANCRVAMHYFERPQVSTGTHNRPSFSSSPIGF